MQYRASTADEYTQYTACRHRCDLAAASAIVCERRSSQPSKALRGASNLGTSPRISTQHRSLACKQNPIGSDVLDRHGCVLRMNLGQSDWKLVECCQRSVLSCVY